MRFWTISPELLDNVGLVACWREAENAFNILAGAANIRGGGAYKEHPQLVRFMETSRPVESFSHWLKHIYTEGVFREYSFFWKKEYGELVTPTLFTKAPAGQIMFELELLAGKITNRAGYTPERDDPKVADLLTYVENIRKDPGKAIVYKSYAVLVDCSDMSKAIWERQ